MGSNVQGANKIRRAAPMNSGKFGRDPGFSQMSKKFGKQPGKGVKKK